MQTITLAFFVVSIIFQVNAHVCWYLTSSGGCTGDYGVFYDQNCTSTNFWGVDVENGGCTQIESYLASDPELFIFESSSSCGGAANYEYVASSTCQYSPDVQPCFPNFEGGYFIFGYYQLCDL